MSQPIIAVENLSKRYQLGVIGATTLRDSLQHAWLRLRGHAPEAQAGEFWALREVSFTVQPGEVIGVIGRNGAGKSTLLKILSRITEPTTGRAVLRGRVSSLLEVGTGFHPELSGRDNVFLNGAILGMTQAEIRRKFDEIVAFAEVEKFLDTPVKRYSSGMYVRLAFAVAAHLDPEILIVDEVLAVGDAAFQKKCLGKMKDVADHESRTILFVSHNLDSVIRLCPRTILLSGGRIIADGDSRATVESYLHATRSSGTVVPLDAPREHPVRGAARLDSLKFPAGSTRPWYIDFGEDFRFSVHFELSKPVEFWQIGIGLFSMMGVEIASWQNQADQSRQACAPGRYRIDLHYQHLKLVPGQYYLGIGLRSDRGIEDYLPEAIIFEVGPNDISAALGADTFQGQLVPEVDFKTERL